jgi:AcrR family transcriptional regulator
MKVKKNDRRVDRTRHALKEALYELLKEKSYEEVTVEEITERANLGRTTFYLHYKDKEELLLEDFVELVDHLVDRMMDIPLLQWIEGQLVAEQSANRPRAIYLVFQHAEAHADLYRIVLRGQGMNQVTEKLRQIIIQAFTDLSAARLTQKNLDISSDIPLDVIAYYFAGSLMGLVTWWLDNNMPYPPEQMALYFQHLFFPGLRKAIRFETFG